MNKDDKLSDASAGDAVKDQDDSSGDAGAGAKSLEALFAEWDEHKDTSDGDKVSKPALPSEILDRLSNLERAEVDRSYKSDMTGMVAAVKGDLKIDDFIVESWINQRADGDERLVELWKDRDSKRPQLKAVTDTLRGEFADWAKDKKLSDDKSAGRKLSAAVASARDAGDSDTGTLGNTDWAGLSDTDFALKKAEVFRMAENGSLH